MLVSLWLSQCSSAVPSTSDSWAHRPGLKLTGSFLTTYSSSRNAFSKMMKWKSTLLLRSFQLAVTLDKPLCEWSNPKKGGISLYQGVRSVDCRIVLQDCAGVPGVSNCFLLSLPVSASSPSLVCLHLILRLEPFLSSANITNSKILAMEWISSASQTCTHTVPVAAQGRSQHRKWCICFDELFSFRYNSRCYCSHSIQTFVWKQKWKHVCKLSYWILKIKQCSFIVKSASLFPCNEYWKLSLVLWN